MRLSKVYQSDLNIKDILAKRLKEYRKQKGLTQAQVAIYCDITEKTYQNYELSTINFSIIPISFVFSSSYLLRGVFMAIKSVSI